MLPVCKPDISRQRMSLLPQSSCHSRSHYSIYSTGLGKPTKKTSCLPPQNIQNVCGIYLNKLIYTLGVTLERTLTKLCCLLPSVFMKKRQETVDIEDVLLLCDLECVLLPRPSWLDECEHSAQLSTGTFCCNIYLHSTVSQNLGWDSVEPIH